MYIADRSLTPLLPASELLTDMRPTYKYNAAGVDHASLHSHVSVRLAWSNT